MIFTPALRGASLLRRYKRFLADVVMDSGEQVTVHCPNTGAMLGCANPGATVWLSTSSNPRRKYRYSWELVQTAEGILVGINTGRSNALVREAIAGDVIPELAGYAELRGEVRYGQESSRADFVLSNPALNGQPTLAGSCVVEVKNVTAAVEQGIALFPDAVSVRARRHLRELIRVVRDGGRSVLCYCVQRDDVNEVRPAWDIDPEYAAALADAAAAGVEIIAYAARIRPTGLSLYRKVRVGGM